MSKKRIWFIFLFLRTISYSLLKQCLEYTWGNFNDLFLSSFFVFFCIVLFFLLMFWSLIFKYARFFFSRAFSCFFFQNIMFGYNWKIVLYVVIIIRSRKFHEYYFSISWKNAHAAVQCNILTQKFCLLKFL